MFSDFEEHFSPKNSDDLVLSKKVIRSGLNDLSPTASRFLSQRESVGSCFTEFLELAKVRWQNYCLMQLNKLVVAQLQMSDMFVCRLVIIKR